MSGYYDFEDPKIRRMVSRHDPTQDWHVDGTPVSVPYCDVCGDTWPCRPIQDLRQWQTDNGNPADYDG